MRIASIFVNLVEEIEDDVEILDVSQYVKENLNVPFDDYNLYDETDEDSGADEGLGSEIIYPKNIQKKEEEAQFFLTEVEKVLKVVSSLWIISGWEFGAEGDFFLLTGGYGGGR